MKALQALMRTGKTEANWTGEHAGGGGEALLAGGGQTPVSYSGLAHALA